MKKILFEADRIAEDGHLTGLTDGMQHPVYQTAWLKHGLHSLGLVDRYTLPQSADNYSHLLWWFPDIPKDQSAPLLLSPQYPYLTWAEDHFMRTHNARLGNQPYPLSWEQSAAKADYDKMEIIDPVYVNKKLCPIHGWGAAEMFLYLLEQKH